MKLVTFSRELFNLDSVKDHTLSQKMFKVYADLFKDEVGDLPVTYSMKVDPEITPAHIVSQLQCTEKWNKSSKECKPWE